MRRCTSTCHAYPEGRLRLTSTQQSDDIKYLKSLVLHGPLIYPLPGSIFPDHLLRSLAQKFLWDGDEKDGLQSLEHCDYYCKPSCSFFVRYHLTIISSKASGTMDNDGTVFYLPLSYIYSLSKGWYSIRNEKKRMMVVFLGIGFIITVGWAVLFYSEVYRWSAFPPSGRNFYLNSFNLIKQEF